MAILECAEIHARQVVFARYLIGRSRLAHLRLHEADVSGEHAVVRWSHARWEIQDLGSRNGTFLNEQRLEPGARAVLCRGDVLGFGTLGLRWRLVDDQPPTAVATAADGDAVLCAEDGFLALPAAADPEVVVYRDRRGHWVIERDGSAEPASDGAIVAVGGRSFVLHLPEGLVPTWDQDSAPPHIERITLCFSVSADEEYVQLVLRGGQTRIDLGARAHHYLLLTLARARLRDHDQPSGAQGWMYLDELAGMLGMDEKHLNVTVHRCRRHLGTVGVIGAADIIERRKPTRQIRLGTARIEISSP